MTNIEIDRKIAELMGYEVFEVDGIECIETVYDYEGNEVFVELPDFSESWASMRLLIEWLQGKGINVFLQVRVAERAAASVRSLEWSFADTAPLALCKAVLSMPPEVLHG